MICNLGDPKSLRHPVHYNTLQHSVKLYNTLFYIVL